MTQQNIPSAVDYVFAGRGIGKLSSTMTDLFRGFNHQNTGVPISPNDDNKGFVFFTMPELNLTYDNVINADEISNLVQPGTEASQLGAIRAWLDPTGNKFGSGSRDGTTRYDPIMCPVVNPNHAFIPILSTLLTSLDGWPDITVESYTSETGIFGEARSYGDGGSCLYGTFDLTATFRNIKGNPITALFFNWCVYINRVGEGSVYPRPEKIVENEIDYETRIYRVVLDNTRTRVTQIAMTGASFPLGSSIGASYGYNAERPTIEENNQIPVQFRCNGAVYESPRVIDAFNDAVAKWNPRMSEENLPSMRRLTPAEAEMLNWEGYPRIEYDRTMHWYVTNEDYADFLNFYGLDPDYNNGNHEAKPATRSAISPDVAAVKTGLNDLLDTDLV